LFTSGILSSNSHFLLAIAVIIDIKHISPDGIFHTVSFLLCHKSSSLVLFFLFVGKKEEEVVSRMRLAAAILSLPSGIGVVWKDLLDLE